MRYGDTKMWILSGIGTSEQIEVFMSKEREKRVVVHGNGAL